MATDQCLPCLVSQVEAGESDHGAESETNGGEQWRKHATSCLGASGFGLPHKVPRAGVDDVVGDDNGSAHQIKRDRTLRHSTGSIDLEEDVRRRGPLKLMAVVRTLQPGRSQIGQGRRQSEKKRRHDVNDDAKCDYSSAGDSYACFSSSTTCCSG